MSMITNGNSEGYGHSSPISTMMMEEVESSRQEFDRGLLRTEEDEELYSNCCGRDSLAEKEQRRMLTRSIVERSLFLS